MTLTAPGTSVAPNPARGLVCRNCGATFGLVAEHACAECFGPPSFVFIPSDLEPGKVVQSAVYGQTLVAVDGSYDDVNRLSSEIAETDEFEDTAFVNQNVRPYYAEGSKTMGYEIAEQLGWRIPAQVVIPMASGSLLTKVDKAWRELAAAGIVEATDWKVFGAQSAGCDPIATAFDNGWDVVRPVKPTGVAVGRVGDEAIVQGIRDLARTTGVFAETAGGVTVAVLRQLVEDGRLDPSQETVVLNTGEGLKTLDPLLPVVGPSHHVQPSLKSLREAGLIS